MIDKLFANYRKENSDIVAAVLTLASVLSKASDDKPLTVPEIAKKLRVRQPKVLAWIRSGRLKAVNITTSGRPRYRVHPDDLLMFMTPVAEQTAQYRRPQKPLVVPTPRRPKHEQS
jgi:excisionase family DNA binding protein